MPRIGHCMGIKITHFTKRKAFERFQEWALEVIDSPDLTQEQRNMIIECVQKKHIPNNLLMGLMIANRKK